MNSSGWRVGQKFCFVDPCNCNQADISLANYFPADRNNGVAIYNSFAACGGVNLWKVDQCGAFGSEGTCNADSACMWDADAMPEVPTPPPTPAPSCVFKSGDDLMKALRKTWGCDANAPLPTSCPCKGTNSQTPVECPSDLKWTPKQGEKCVR